MCVCVCVCVCVCLVAAFVSARSVSEAVRVKRDVGYGTWAVSQWFRDCAHVKTSRENKSVE